MGVINCKSTVRYSEESKSEADISNYFNDKLQKTQDIYHSMTNRVLTDKEKLLKGVQNNSISYPKNYDPYYSFLLEQLKGTTRLTLNTPLKSGKENLFNCKKSIRSSRCVDNKLANATNIYLETRTNTSFFKKEQSKPRVLCSVRNRNYNEQITLSCNPNKRFNFDIISLLPYNIQAIIINYLINQYKSLLCISAVWHSNIIFTFDILFSPLENSLIEKLKPHLTFKNSFTQSNIHNKKELRVDRVILLEVNKALGKTIEISYIYCFINDKKNMYRTQYKVDCVNKRTVWIHRSENILTGRQYTYNMNIGQVSEGDIIEIAINYYTPRGLIDINSIKWGEITLRNLKSSDEVVKLEIDLNRVCELETMGSEWYDSKYYKMTKQFYDLDALLQCFVVKSIEFTELDIKAFKIRLEAYRVGSIEKSVVGIPIIIKPCGMRCVMQVKRLGLMIDREGDLELRVGDTLVLYLSKHKHE